jgi:hypothetical protein
MLPPDREEVSKVIGLRFADIESKPYVVLDMTSLVVEEFRALVEPFEEEFRAHTTKWRLDGLPRTARIYTTYKNCPLPTPEDRLLFVLDYLKNNPLQTMHGCTFGMPQCKANVWLHVLLPVLQRTLSGLKHAPSRSVAGLAKRLNVTMEEAGQIVEHSKATPQQEAQEAPEQSSLPADTPLFVTMAPSEVSRAPRTQMTRSSITTARKRKTP